MYYGWGNHTSARHNEAMKLQETQPDSGPNYTTKDGALNPAALICICCGKTGHQLEKCPHAEKQGTSERIAEGILRVENKKTRTKNNVDAVKFILAAKGVDTQSLSFNKDFSDRAYRSSNTPAPRPVVSATPTIATHTTPATSPDMVSCMLQALLLFLRSKKPLAADHCRTITPTQCWIFCSPTFL